MSMDQTRSEPGHESAPSLAELLSSLADDVTTLVRQELQLAKVEAKLEAAKAARAGILFGAAAVMALLSLALLAWAASWALAEQVEEGVAFVIVAAVVALLATALGMAGRQRLKQVAGIPRTTQTLKEDRQWLSNQTH